mgnify:CR=1 FL=1
MEENKYTVEIKINGEDVLLNPFVQNFYTSTILGSIHALKDIPDTIKSLTINIEKKS